MVFNVSFLNCQDSSSVWVRSLDELVNINKTIGNILDINIYPNPASDKLYIDIPFFKNSKVEIISFDGQLLQSNYLVSPITQIDLKNLARGIYEIQIINEKGFAIRKLIKQ
ncbi:MAG: T9SS type A sorting domain-containing protein [Bacteroidia bacterium]|nr:T9SS type A sorting domain-containing protein [Bacteroidia bacterium]